MNDNTVTSGAISGALSVLISLFFGFFPGVKVRFDALTADKKGLVMLLAVTAATLVGFFLPWFLSGDPFSGYYDRQSIVEFFVVWIAALTANQGVYLTAVRPRQA